MQRAAAKVQSELSSISPGSHAAADNVRYWSSQSLGLQTRDVEDRKSPNFKEDGANSDANDVLIYDSFSLHFNWRIVLEQLVLNITFPWLIPVFIHKYGWLFLHSQSFYPSTTVYFIQKTRALFPHFCVFLFHPGAHRDLVGHDLSACDDSQFLFVS
jgi:hypothetical protein